MPSWFPPRRNDRITKFVHACILKWGAFTYYEHIVYREGFVLNCSIWFTVWCSRVSWWNKRRGESNLHKAATPGMRCCLPFGELTLGWKQNYLQLFGNQNVIQEKDILMLHAAAAGGETQFNFLHFKTLMGNIFVSSALSLGSYFARKNSKSGIGSLKNFELVRSLSLPVLQVEKATLAFHFEVRWKLSRLSSVPIKSRKSPRLFLPITVQDPWL